ncbi:hypothetical protein BO78DRAFT_471299 [Aspergillus sclerotiicarbonarius CBS 121057]|uniref:Uncharacterized protein n=1 Tax=Aspergillus sclerotiicarbonarius (strain CBS 121057 / IBT 28362) TaxID=1448318 RepID=A0A319ED62_ASPSB|nr:hypothetical protein BO78DRAFT_471299 [Aspergillus sclerotiicarbonarius CBS 121057]
MTMHLAEFTYDYVDHSFNEAKRDKERERFLNANIFTIKLHYRLPPHSESKVMIGYGSWGLMKTLESTPWEKYHHPRIEAYLEHCEDDDSYNEARDEELEILDIRTLNGFVPAAAVWIEYCGKEIYEKEGSLGQEYPAYDKWTGPKGWSKERWALWKGRFEWISTVTALDRKTRKIAKGVMEQMGRIGQGEDGMF